MSLTPKPWKYGTRRDGSKWLSLGDPTRGQHRQGDLVATKEDADLICAAPDLYEAVIELIDAMVRYEADVDADAAVPSQHYRMMEKARAAIAKAEGGAA